MIRFSSIGAIRFDSILEKSNRIESNRYRIVFSGGPFAIESNRIVLARSAKDRIESRSNRDRIEIGDFVGRQEEIVLKFQKIGG